jgi:hypothetical protein
VTTLLGKVVYERAYYHCEDCGCGIFPTDAEFGMEQKKTAGARELMALAGVLEPFAEGAQDVLPRMSGLNVSASTVEDVTKAEGDKLAAMRAAGELIGPEEVWDWNVDATGATVGYVSLDATGVPQQGPRGEKAEGRMPWVAAVFNPQPTHEEHRRRRIWESRYVAGLMSLEEIGAQLRRECERVGLAQVDRVIALTDGGAGLENCLWNVLGGLVDEVVFILDFWHVSDKIQEFAKVYLPDDQQRQQQVKAWCHRLKHEGGQALLEDLQGLDLTRASPAVREAHRRLTGYLRNNLHRMDYPRYIACGWQIGSGKIESACKTVVGQRLKRSGMRWRTYGTTALCQLRALYKSPTLWQHYWKHTAVT